MERHLPTSSRLPVCALLLFASLLGVDLAGAGHVASVDVRDLIVLRVHFDDYAAMSQFTRPQVEQMMSEMASLWRNTSYGAIDLRVQVTDLYELPGDRSDYVTDFGDGDVPTGTQFGDTLNDAIANAPAGLDWSSVDAVLVVMAERDTSQFYRGWGGGGCMLPRGPGGPSVSMGCTVVSENPGDNWYGIWGRAMHEIGHAFQNGGPLHPSDYNNEFELMDNNLPGHTGPFEKQSHLGFRGWLPGHKYQVITRASGGATANLWTMENDVDGRPNAQAAKIEVTASLYYLVSVRRRVMGDELNGDFQWPPAGERGIPDEGVLIERVVEGGSPWVNVTGPGNDRNTLWQRGETYNSRTYPDARMNGDGIVIQVLDKPEGADDYGILVRFSEEGIQPDVMLQPWVSPPGNTWETTDIWVDSPVNGYGTYRYGTWNDLAGDSVPRGNGDDPAIGQQNRLYARVRNVGTAPAADVVVTWERTDPMGLGISGAAGWAEIGHLGKDAASSSVGVGDPQLASIAPGDSVDVWIPWTPAITLTDQDVQDGRIAFHTCVRVKLDAVAGETVLGNQDGDREQENIDYFSVPDASGGGGPPPSYERSIRLRNDDPAEARDFFLHVRSDAPEGWKVLVNGGQPALRLAPGEVRDVPVFVQPQHGEPVGASFGVDVSASTPRLLVNEDDPKDTHYERGEIGGVRVEFRVLSPTTLECRARWVEGGRVAVTGRLAYDKQHHDPDERLIVMGQGVAGGPTFLTGTTTQMRVRDDGAFEGHLSGKDLPEARKVLCAFAGTTHLDAASAYVPLDGTPTPPTAPTGNGTLDRAGDEETTPVPGPGLLALVGILMVAAIALRRR